LLTVYLTESRKAAALPRIEAQYGDFCVEERQWLRSVDFSEQVNQWQRGWLVLLKQRAALFGATESLRKAIPWRSGPRPVESSVFQRLSTVAAEIGVSRYAFMLGVFDCYCQNLAAESLPCW